MNITIFSLLATAMVLFGLPVSAQPVDQIPMYGGFDRAADPAVRDADEKLFTDTTKHYGSREKASAAFVSNGFGFYGRDDLAAAMRRFNQAWLLDPKNPEVYFGFAVILHDKGNNCEAIKQFDKAASFGTYIRGMAPDAARVIVLCTIDDKSLSEEARSTLIRRSEALYVEALAREPDKGYVHASMASAFYWRKKYPEAWAAVKLSRASGGRLPEQFLRMLREKMVEPE
jgi:tetratricopeptide (TPR) repeat protein